MLSLRFSHDTATSVMSPENVFISLLRALWSALRREGTAGTKKLRGVPRSSNPPRLEITLFSVYVAVKLCSQLPSAPMPACAPARS